MDERQAAKHLHLSAFTLLVRNRRSRARIFYQQSAESVSSKIMAVLNMELGTCNGTKQKDNTFWYSVLYSAFLTDSRHLPSLFETPQRVVCPTSFNQWNKSKS